ncbi:MAG: folylpolyglutamate synthase/dihydrofolate synthase family protein [Acidobacteriota bacterium]
MSSLSTSAQRYLDRLDRFGIRPGLETTRRLCRHFGHPQTTPAVLVAGTNGKGSCSAMLHSVLTSTGLNAGLYTSPHLVDVTERIRMKNSDIDHAALSALLDEIEDASEALLRAGEIERQPTYFEAVTIAAFLYFKRSRCDIAVLEVGMGGRFDATNVVDPILSVITSISHDHEDYLGSSLAEIASEKAGIMRAGIPAISAEQSAEVAGELRRQAAAIGAPLEFPPPLPECACGPDGRYSVRADASAPWIGLPLAGAHQVSNAALVLDACRRLGAFGINSSTVRAGIESCSWPGRLELVARAPDIYLDGCHNPAGAATAATFTKSLDRSPRVLVFGCMKDKKIRMIAEALFPAFDAVVLTAVRNPRAAPPEMIEEITRDLAVPCSIEPDLPRIIGPGPTWRYQQIAVPPGGLIMISGSLYLVGAAKLIAAGAG